MLITRMVLISKVESIYARFIIFCVERLLSLRKQPVEGMWVQLKSLRAIYGRLFTF